MIIDSGEVLAKVNHYKYFRNEYTVRIEIYEILLGEGEKFIAAPVEALGGATKNLSLHIKRENEEKALEDLISALQSLSRDEIFPKE